MLKNRKKFKIPHLDLDEVQLLYALSGLVILTALSLGLWFGVGWWKAKHQKANNLIEEIKQEEQKIEDKDCDFRRVLDGVCVSSIEEINPKLVVVMVENHPDARPLSGLSKASVVYEVMVEGNYTRFLLIYPVGMEVDKVGPVRSARSYYLDWVSEYGDAMYFHVGGSPEALKQIANYKINDVNEFYRGWYFWRSTDRYAPHNTYTSNKLWEKTLQDYLDEYVVDEYNGWKFGQIENCTSDCKNNIEINFGSMSFTADWEYNSSTEKYVRSQSGLIQHDQDGEFVEADTIIIQTVKARVLDEVGRLGMDTIGEGKITVFVKGKMIEGRWQKESRKERTRWLDDNGEELVLSPGKVWVEVVSERTEVKIDLD